MTDTKDQSLPSKHKLLYELCGIYRASFVHAQISMERDLTDEDNLDMAMRSLQNVSEIEGQLKKLVIGME